MLIEQAVFASAITGRAEGYQLLGRSRGLSEDEGRELTAWGPSHDSMLDAPGARASVNFHRLGSGNYCVSRTTQSNAEYSGRGGAGVYTQFLVMTPDTLRRFANNPFAVLRAAAAAGLLQVHEQVPNELEPLQLGGRSSMVDLPLLAQLARDPGPAALGTLIQAALSSDRLAVAASVPRESLIAGLFSTLPVECRTDFSFTTGLRHSARRDVRICALPDDKASWRPMSKAGFTLLNIERGDQADNVGWQGWAGHVARILRSGKLSILSGELEQVRPDLACDQLNHLAELLEAQHLATGLDLVEPTPGTVANGRLRIVAAEDDVSPAGCRGEAVSVAGGSTSATLGNVPRPGAAATLWTQSPEVVEMLERVDDLVFAAIGGKEQALGELTALWPTVLDRLGPELVEQSREQYLRCALGIWSQCADEQIHRPERAMAAIDVLCVLFEE